LVEVFESAFANYLHLVNETGARTKLEVGSSGNLRVLKSEKQRILSEVEDLEQSPQFRALCDATQREFSRSWEERNVGNYWDGRLRTFFRLSGTYEARLSREAFAKHVDEERILAAKFREEISAKTVKRIQLAPIEFVSFDKETIEFDGFRVKRFTTIKLDDLLKQRACRLFFPWAVIDTDDLADYWFLSCENEMPFPKSFEWNFGAQVEAEYSPFSGGFKEAFRRLILYRWRDSTTPDDQLRTKATDPWASPFLVGVPFVLAVLDSLIASPERAPDLDVLATEPCCDSDGHELGQQRVVAWDLSKEETEEFESFIGQIDACIKNARISASELRFLDTALNFLEKAFLSRRAEQLLWHITTIEALIGENKRRLTELLSSRLGRALGRSIDERKRIRGAFEELYRFRSDLVHGNAAISDKKIFPGHLGLAREMARRLAVWMLHYVSTVRGRLTDSAEMPSRETLLLALDNFGESRAEISALLEVIPEDFPNSLGW
jgi:hypothetical protein